LVDPAALIAMSPATLAHLGLAGVSGLLDGHDRRS
jgi:hypothetical protein